MHVMWAVDAICIVETGPQLAHEEMPERSRAIDVPIKRNYLHRLGGIGAVKQQEFYRRCPLAVHGEVHAVLFNRHPYRVWSPRLHHECRHGRFRYVSFRIHCRLGQSRQHHALPLIHS